MQLNHVTKQLSAVGRFLATTVLCVLAIAICAERSSEAIACPGTFFSNTAAMAEPTANLIASASLGDQIQGKASEDAVGAKGFIEDTKQKLKQTAKKNAARVDQATDNGSYVERKAKRDAARIEKRADEDAARTKSAVDKTKNVVSGTVDKIKDAFKN